MARMITTLVTALAFSTAAMAAQPVATLVDANGKVRVNSGAGFAPAASMMELKTGDTIMVGEEASASVSFGECTVNIDKPMVFTVTDKSACEAGAVITPTGGEIVSAGVHPGLVAAAFIGTVGAVCLLTKCLKDSSP